MMTVSAVNRLAVTFADLRVVDRVVASIASSPRLGRRMPMKRHDDSQRSDRLPVTFAHPGDSHESLTARRAYASVPHLGFGRMVMKRHDDRQRSDRFAVTRPVHHTPPPPPPTFSNRETTNRSG